MPRSHLRSLGQELQFATKTCLVALGVCCGVFASAQAQASPKIVIIDADGLGWGDLACHGYPTIRTPHLERIAAEEVRFTEFDSAAEVRAPGPAAEPTDLVLLRERSSLWTSRRVLSPRWLIWLFSIAMICRAQTAAARKVRALVRSFAARESFAKSSRGGRDGLFFDVATWGPIGGPRRSHNLEPARFRRPIRRSADCCDTNSDSWSPERAVRRF